MSIVKENYLTEGLSGKHGKKVNFRQLYGKTILARNPVRRKMPTPAQVEAKERFLDAVDYAQQSLAVPELLEFYRNLAPLGRSAYNMAVADFLSLPRIVSIDASQYTGEPGETISITAADKCCVKRVTVSILDATSQVIETGQATSPGSGRAWTYTVTAENPDPSGCRIEVCVSDMPNHLVTGSVTIG